MHREVDASDNKDGNNSHDSDNIIHHKSKPAAQQTQHRLEITKLERRTIHSFLPQLDSSDTDGLHLTVEFRQPDPTGMSLSGLTNGDIADRDIISSYAEVNRFYASIPNRAPATSLPIRRVEAHHIHTTHAFTALVDAEDKLHHVVGYMSQPLKQ